MSRTSVLEDKGQALVGGKPVKPCKRQTGRVRLPHRYPVSQADMERVKMKV